MEEFKNRVKDPSSYEDEVDAVDEEMIYEAQVDEVGAEKHHAPPAEEADDEERKFVKIKKSKKRRRKSKAKREDERRSRNFEKLGLDELLGKNLVMLKYMKDEVDEENTILDMNEESTKSFDDKCNNNEEV